MTLQINGDKIKTPTGSWIENLIGQKFGHLTVLGLSTKKYANSRNYLWDVQCDCGARKVVAGTELKRKHGTKTCAKSNCPYYLEYRSKSSKKIQTGAQFGKLTVMEYMNYKTYGCYVYKCICSCGNVVYANTNQLYQGLIQSCGCLVSRGENKCVKYFKLLNINYQQQKTFNDCVNPYSGYKLRFDFYLPDYNLCIEYDGEQHFRVTNGWNDKENFDKTQYRDSIKNKFCEDNNINLIRIPYTDYDKIDEQYILDVLKPFENQTKDGDANDSASI